MTDQLGHILVVEDDQANLELTIDLLEVAGFDVLGAPDAETGIAIARRVLPDLILMDIGLPGMDGIAAADVLRNDVRTRHIPVVAATSHAMKGDQENIVSAGFFGYIPKPIDTRTFAATVASLLRSRRAGKDVQHVSRSRS